MTKNELVNYLRSLSQAEHNAYEARDKIQKVERQIAECKKEPVQFKRLSIAEIIGSFLGILIFGSIVWLVVLLVIILVAIFTKWEVSFPIFDVLFNYFRGIIPIRIFDIHEFLAFFLTCVVTFLPIALIATVLYARVHDKRVPKLNEESMKKHQAALARIPELEAALRVAQGQYSAASSLRTQLQNKGVLPEKYRNKAGFLLEYLEDGRADTLKEAINLFVLDCQEADRYWQAKEQHEEMMATIDAHAAAIQDEVGRAADAAEDAADAAHDAAFWSAAGTFLTASEIDRQRKKGRDGL